MIPSTFDLPTFTQNHPAGFKDIMTPLMEGHLFWMVEVDIHIPEHLHSKFSEMSPLFWRTEVPFEEIGEHMQDFTMSMNYSTNARKTLIGGMSARKNSFSNPLA